MKAWVLSVRVRRSARRCYLVAGLVIAAAGCGSGEVVPGHAEAGGADTPLPDQSPSLGLDYSTPFITPGITQPETLPAAEAQLAADARVIGVAAGGRHRAYSVRAMSGMTTHIVNDLINDVPVTVTYCNQTDCTRVFTTDQRRSPIDLWLGGRVNGEMLLRYREQNYGHLAEEIPLEDHPFVLTTWEEWCEQHPDCDVYVGEGDRHSGGSNTDSSSPAPGAPTDS